MNEMIIKCDNSADLSLLKKIIENIKGVVEVQIKRSKNLNDKSLRKSRMHALSDNIDMGYIDFDDEKTRYILSK